MSHELRTPLNAIIGYSEMLQETAQDEGQDEFLPDLAKIRDAGRHLLGLINDILDLSKIEAGKMDLYLEEVDLAGLIEEVRSIVEPLAAANGNRLEIACPAALGMFYTDRTKLKQSLLNLLSNAGKFTHDGRIRLEVRRRRGETSLHRQRHRHRHDRGAAEPALPGLQPGRCIDEPTIWRHRPRPRDHQAFLRDARRQDRRREHTRAGLDLYDHTARSPPRRCRLPRDATGRRTCALVMIVDDDPNARDLLAATVRREGYRVIEAPDGETALALAREWHPDVVTLDVLMPRMDGWAVMTALKSDPELAEIPVIIVTMLAERGLAVSLGAAEFLTKPVDRARLATTLRRHVYGDGVVLVVDDEEESRRIARRHLESLAARSPRPKTAPARCSGSNTTRVRR